MKPPPSKRDGHPYLADEFRCFDSMSPPPPTASLDATTTTGPHHVLKHATSSSGPLASLDRSAASLRFLTGEVLVLIRPSASSSTNSSTTDRDGGPWPVLRGAIELQLPRAKKVRRLEVEGEST